VWRVAGKRDKFVSEAQICFVWSVCVCVFLNIIFLFLKKYCSVFSVRIVVKNLLAMVQSSFLVTTQWCIHFYFQFIYFN
jgi:hypothetical protein